MLRNTIIALFTTALLLGCATTPRETNSELVAAQQRLLALENDTTTQRYAGTQLDIAANAVGQATSTWRESGVSSQFRHHLYVAQRQLDIAEAQTSVKALQASSTELAEQREQLQLQARAVRAELAEARSAAQAASAAQQAALSAAEAAEARQERLAAEQRRELAEQQQLAAERQRIEAEQQRLAAEQQRAQAEARAEAAAAEAQQAQRELAELRRQVEELQAKETERGLQLTLQDVLFDFNAADLKSGAERQMAKLADFLSAYPNRQVSIEGFTDSVGSDTYNQNLSEQRAGSVRDALITNGVAADRIMTRGYGEEFPLASNNTETGRAQNRRVEIIISYDDQPVPERS